MFVVPKYKMQSLNIDRIDFHLANQFYVDICPP